MEGKAQGNGFIFDSPIGSIYSSFKYIYIYIYSFFLCLGKIYYNSNDNNKIEVIVILFKKSLIR